MQSTRRVDPGADEAVAIFYHGLDDVSILHEPGPRVVNALFGGGQLGTIRRCRKLLPQRRDLVHDCFVGSGGLERDINIVRVSVSHIIVYRAPKFLQPLHPHPTLSTSTGRFFSRSAHRS